MNNQMRPRERTVVVEQNRRQFVKHEINLCFCGCSFVIVCACIFRRRISLFMALCLQFRRVRAFSTITKLFS